MYAAAFRKVFHSEKHHSTRSRHAVRIRKISAIAEDVVSHSFVELGCSDPNHVI
jgi:hypothetical protein